MFGFRPRSASPRTQRSAARRLAARLLVSPLEDRLCPVFPAGQNVLPGPVHRGDTVFVTYFAHSPDQNESSASENEPLEIFSTGGEFKDTVFNYEVRKTASN